MNSLDLAVVNHEAGHAAAAALLGMEVVRVKANRHALAASSGESWSRFRPLDERSPAVRAADRAVVALVPLHLPLPPERDVPLRAYDSDVAAAHRFAGIAGASDPDEFVGRAGARARELVCSDAFRALYDQIAAALVESPGLVLTGREVESLLSD